MNPVALSLLAGFVFAFALPPHAVAPLAYVALGLMLASFAQTKRPLHAAGLGLLTALCAGGWQVGAFPVGGTNGYAYAPFLFMGAVFAVMGAAACWAFARLKSWQWVLFVACAGVLCEWMTIWTPLPVGVALTQFRFLPLLQIASVAGIWGVSWVTWLCGAVMAVLTDRNRRLGLSQIIVGLCFVFFIVLLSFMTGLFFPNSDIKDSDTAYLRVAAVQDFAPPEGKYGGDAGAARAELTKTAGSAANLVVWSEACEGNSFQPNNSQSEAAKIARSNSINLVIGYLESAQPKDFNNAAFISSEGKTLGIHRKNALFLGERTTIQAGHGATVVNTDGNIRGIGKVGLLICFDTCAPALTREAVQKGAKIIAVPNHDPVVPNRVLHNLHAALMPFRAVENGVAIVRADDAGLSQIISPSGLILKQAAQDTAEVIVADVPLGDGHGTFYTRWGDWFVIACGIGAAILLASGNRTKPSANAPRTASPAATPTPQ